MGSALDLTSLPPAAKKRFLEQQGRKRSPRKTDFPKDRARTYAIRCLGVLAELRQDQRERVLRLASQMNAV
jgi:hypothetical protein